MFIRRTRKSEMERKQEPCTHDTKRPIEEITPPTVGICTGQDQKQKGPVRQVPDIIIIDDDDDDDGGGGDDNNDHFDDQNLHLSYKMNSIADGHKGDDVRIPNRSTGWPSAEGFSTDQSGYSDYSDENDCVVMNRNPLEPGPSQFSWPTHRRLLKGEKRPAQNMFYVNKLQKSSTSSSDCEIVEDLDGKIRQEWETAALKKRFGSAFSGGRYRAESEESTSASCPAGSSAKSILNWRRKSTYGDLEPCCSGPSASFPKEIESSPAILFDQQGSNNECADVGSEDSSGEEVSLSDTESGSSGNEAESFDGRANSSCLGTIPVEFRRKSLNIGEFNTNIVHGECSSHEVYRKLSDHLFVNGEAEKATKDVQEVQEENLVSQQEKTLLQAPEAIQYQKKRKFEAECILATDSERIEEFKKKQQKEQHNPSYKETIRCRIRNELESVAAGCVDMATLLRNLGVEVDGGDFPSIQQVNAAYKKALLRFHPDRVAAASGDDPLHQVEAEETFKLISEMKNTLQPVAVGYC